MDYNLTDPSVICNFHGGKHWWGEVQYTAGIKDPERDLMVGDNVHSDLCVDMNDEGRKIFHDVLDEFLNHTKESREGFFYIGGRFSDLQPEDAIRLLKELISGMDPDSRLLFNPNLEKKYRYRNLYDTLNFAVQEAEKAIDTMNTMLYG